MPKRLVPKTRWTRAAAAACVGAAALLGFQFWRADSPSIPAPGQQQPPAGQDSGPDDHQAASSEFELPAAEDYAEIIERPLFSRSRRPAPPQEASPGATAAAGEEAAGRIALNGVLLTGTRRVALLRFDNDTKVMHVAEGQEAGGWLIEKIGADRVIVRRGQQESEIVLDFKKSSSQQGAVPVPLSSPDPDAELPDEEDQPE